MIWNLLEELDSGLSTIEEEKKKNLFAADMVLFHEPGLNGLNRKLILKANNCQNKTTLNRNGSLLAGILQVSTGGV